MSRFYHLAKHRPDQVYLVFLVRNPLGIAASSKKRGGDPIESVEGWIRGNLSRYRILRKLRDIPSIVVHYEKYCKDPINERDRLAEFLGQTAPDNDIQINSKNYHLIAGNPMRFTEKISINYDESWKTTLDRVTINRIMEIIDSCPLSFSDYLRNEEYWEWMETQGSSEKEVKHFLK